MKYLEIKDNKGFFWNGSEMIEIDRLNKDDLLGLLNHAEEDSFEMDLYDENLLPNKAHQIIYQAISTKFNEFLTDKDQFNRDVDALYVEAVGKYGADVQVETDEEKIEEIETTDDEISLVDIPF
jgi:hypothetical protein